MAEAARLCEGLGATFIDINMGLPGEKGDWQIIRVGAHA